MGIIEDVRKVIQDLVTPDLKALASRIDSHEETTQLKIDNVLDKIVALSEKTDSRFEAVLDKLASLKELIEANNKALNAKIDSNHATVIYSLNIDKRLEALESDRQRDRNSETASA
jgi:uncharacterized protein YqgV (UPF0045/DUF77 family)